MNSWPRGRSADGGIDEIPLAPPPGERESAGDDGPLTGRLWLCGKHLVGPDPAAAMARVDATAILCLNERHEIAERYPDYVAWLTAEHEPPSPARWFPTPDLGTVPLERFAPLVERSVEGLRAGDRLIAHCGAGIGRAGTFAAAVLIAIGHDVGDALDVVGRHRPMAGPEAGAQRALIDQLADRYHPNA